MQEDGSPHPAPNTVSRPFPIRGNCFAICAQSPRPRSPWGEPPGAWGTRTPRTCASQLCSQQKLGRCFSNKFSPNVKLCKRTCKGAQPSSEEPGARVRVSGPSPMRSALSTGPMSTNPALRRRATGAGGRPPTECGCPRPHSPGVLTRALSPRGLGAGCHAEGGPVGEKGRDQGGVP